MDVLIELLGDKSETVRDNAWAAVQRYVGGEVKFRAFGRAQWREWWSTERDAFVPSGE